MGGQPMVADGRIFGAAHASAPRRSARFAVLHKELFGDEFIYGAAADHSAGGGETAEQSRRSPTTLPARARASAAWFRRRSRSVR